MNIKLIIKQIFYIFLLALVSGILVNAISANGISLIYSAPDLSGQEYLSAENTFQLFKEGRVLFVDSRYPEDFQKSHIKNAINIPAAWSVDKIDQLMQNYDKDRFIVVYCSSPECNSSIRIAGTLKFIKFSNVYIFTGGIREWQANEYPLVSEENP